MGLARIGIGANLGDPEKAVRGAIAALAQLGTPIGVSSLYRSAPWGVKDQPEFVNAAVLLETPLEPRALLAALKDLEIALGRRPGPRWGPRAIDLDILAYDDRRLDEPGLVIPHPELRARAFALVPLAEIDSSFRGDLERLDRREREGVRRLESL